MHVCICREINFDFILFVYVNKYRYVLSCSLSPTYIDIWFHYAFLNVCHYPNMDNHYYHLYYVVTYWSNIVLVIISLIRDVSLIT